MNKKGFTLIELLVASVILIIVMLGFLRGILFYVQLSVREQTKERAIEIMKEVASRVETLPYCPDNMANCLNPYLHAYGGYAVSDWANSTCDIGNQCSFENRDSDGDGLRDFRDPYSGNNNSFFSNPIQVSSWLNIKPGSGGICLDRNGNTLPNLRCGEQFKGRWIYVGTTLSKIVRYNIEVGKAVGIVVWYFEPSTQEYIGYTTTFVRNVR